MGTIDADDLRAALFAVADTMDENRDALCKLDGEIGDADHGVAMALGFGAVREAVAGLDTGAAPSDVLNTAARAFLNAAGASSGPLYATAFMRAAACVKGKHVLDAADSAAGVESMATGIAHRGKAALGDKTMLDAWRPAADTAKGDTPAEVFRSAAKPAKAAAKATAGMEARIGRAARPGARSLGHIDPGAASAALLLQAMSEQLA